MTSQAKFASIFIAALLSAGAANAHPKLSSDLQKQAVAMRYVGCLTKAADKYDDRVSDASIIAARIAPVCADQFAREQAAFSEGLDASQIAAYRESVASDQPALATQIVLSERDWKKSHRNNRVAQSN